jgi:cytochrome c oxidase accessory protein FixG
MNKTVNPSDLTSDDDNGPLYAARKKVYPQSVSGTFRRIKWGLMAFCLGVYYFLPFVRWNRGLGAPSQAVLIDLPNSRFYFFFIELWPQEVYYFTGLLIVAAVALFLMNSVGGRIWCGYLCPQTVWTDLFYAVERLIEGDRRERMKKDKSSDPMKLERISEIVLKHSIWLLIAWWTGGAWVLYFNAAPTLVKELVTFQAPMIAYVWIGILTATTYVLAGYMREQVCTYMCPWPRIQAALTDEWALNVTYRYDRGEPRNSLKKAAALREAGAPAGDCVDCNQCVNVCPTGVDIRDGLQIDCIQCGLCIDACDNIMVKVGRPTGLIGYDTDINVKRREAGKPELKTRILRARTIVYAAVIAIVGSTMAVALATRNSSGLAVIHDRNPLFVTLQDGAIRNAYTVRLSNKIPETRTFEIRVKGFDPSQVDSAAGKRGPNGWPVLSVDPDQTLEDRVFLTQPRNTARHGHEDGRSDIVFDLVDVKSGASVRVKDHFMQPDGDKK